MGGPHVTELPDEALGRSGGVRHTDAVALGEADETWPRIVQDVVNGTLKDVYAPVDAFGQDKKPNLGAYPKIPWESIDLDQFHQIPRILRPVPKRVHFQISANLLRDEELVDLIAESGGKWVFIGMESLDPANLKDVNKSFNKPSDTAPSWPASRSATSTPSRHSSSASITIPWASPNARSARSAIGRPACPYSDKSLLFRPLPLHASSEGRPPHASHPLAGFRSIQNGSHSSKDEGR